MSDNIYTNRELSRTVHRVPLWRALRWLVRCVFTGKVDVDG